MPLESRAERLHRRQDVQRQRHDRWFRLLTESLVVSSLLYLLLRSPLGRTWLEGAAQILARQ